MKAFYVAKTLVLAVAIAAGSLTAQSLSYQDGLRALDAHDWHRAVRAFASVIERKSTSSDGALYWKAYAENRSGDRTAALRTLAQMRNKMPESKWLADAAALETEMQASDAHVQSVAAASSTDTNVKLLAINSLLAAKPAIALPALKNVLSGSSPVDVKDRALFVLAQSSSADAHRVLADTARSAPDPALRVHAVRYVALLGTNNERQDLVALFRAETQPEVRNAILQGLAMRKDVDGLKRLARDERDSQHKMEILRYLFFASPQEAAVYAK